VNFLEFQDMTFL